MRNISAKARLMAAVMTLLCAATASAQGAKVMTWMVGGDRRQAIVYAPSVATTGNRAPLVLSFHGHGDNMQNFQQTGLHRA